LNICITKLLLALPIFSMMAGCASLRAQFENEPKARQFVLQRDWAQSTLRKEFLGYRRMNRMTPLVLDQMVIQGNAIDGIAAFNRQTGSLIWRLDLTNGVEGGAQVADGKLYFGASDGQFYCVDVMDGRLLWTFPVRAETLAPPTIEKGVVYFQSGASVVYALDAASGKQLWIYNRQATTPLSIRATTRPVIAGDTIYVGFADGFLAAIKKTDGTLLWDRKLGHTGRFKDVDASPVIQGDLIYVDSFDGSLYCLKQSSGEVVWQTDEGGYTPVTISGDRLYYATSTGKIMALDKGSGQTLWSTHLKRGIATQPQLYKGFLVYGESEGSLVVAESSSGRVISQFDPGRGLVSSPAVNESTGEVFFVSNNANLFALHIGLKRPTDLLPWQ
jgi:outer membrane protein assembly factor BamB